MSGIKSQSFLHGAAVLAVGGIVVKILGALFKIPLGAILKPEGMACFSIAYNIYALLFVLSTAGVPIAVSKMIAEAVALGKFNEIGRIYKVSYIAFSFAGVLMSVLMAYFAKPLAQLMGSPESSLSIRAIAPAVMFVSVIGINRGYYQGHANMYPTAISEIIEALGKLIFGLGAAWWLSRCGQGAATVSAGATLGITLGALLSAAYFMFVPDFNFKVKARGEKRSKRKILTELLRLSIPITLGAAVISLTNVIDSAVAMNILQKSGATVRESMWLYGAYTYAANLFNLPSTLVLTIAISLIPQIAAAYVRRDIARLNKTMESALKIAMLIAFSAAAGLYALSTPVISLLYGGSIGANAVNASSGMLKTLTLAVPLLATVSLSNSIHQSMGNVRLPVISMVAGAVVKLISNIILIGIPEININGAPISTVICYAVIASINMYGLIKHKYINIRMPQIYLKPFIVGVMTGYAANYVKGMFSPRIGEGYSAIPAVLFGILACAIAMVITKTLTKDDISLVTRSKKSRFLLKYIEKFDL